MFDNLKNDICYEFYDVYGYHDILSMYKTEVINYYNGLSDTLKKEFIRLNNEEE